jgi:hypothetical protein
VAKNATISSRTFGSPGFLAYAISICIQCGDCVVSVKIFPGMQENFRTSDRAFPEMFVFSLQCPSFVARDSRNKPPFFGSKPGYGGYGASPTSAL